MSLQVQYVALVTKQASSVSDLRRHTFASPQIKVGEARHALALVPCPAPCQRSGCSATAACL